jgi:hypothetical protein
MLTSPVGPRPEKGCSGDARQKLKTTDLTSRQMGAPHQQTCKSLKIIKERRGGKLVVGPRWVPDSRTDWLTACRP